MQRSWLSAPSAARRSCLACSAALVCAGPPGLWRGSGCGRATSGGDGGAGPQLLFVLWLEPHPFQLELARHSAHDVVADDVLFQALIAPVRRLTELQPPVSVSSTSTAWLSAAVPTCNRFVLTPALPSGRRETEHAWSSALGL